MLVEKCTETVKEVILAKTTLSEDENKHKCSSCTAYTVLLSITFTINIRNGIYFDHWHWYLKKTC